jgi:acetyl esterase/lipase
VLKSKPSRPLRLGTLVLAGVLLFALTASSGFAGSAGAPLADETPTPTATPSLDWPAVMQQVPANGAVDLLPDASVFDDVTTLDLPTPEPTPQALDGAALQAADLGMAPLPASANVAAGSPNAAAAAVLPPVLSDIPYGPDALNKLDIYRPDPSLPGPRPAVVVIHGGGFTGGGKAEIPNPNQLNSGPGQEARNLADAGFVAFSINYRLGTLSPTCTPGCTTGLHYTTIPGTPSQDNFELQDARMAMRWVRQHASDYGVDPTRVAAVGGSAGGTLALLLGNVGVRGDDKPDVVASFSGPAYLRLPPHCGTLLGSVPCTTAINSGGMGILNPPSIRWQAVASIIQFIGCTPAADPRLDIPPAPALPGSCEELWDAASPALHVTADTPPTYLLNTWFEISPPNMAQVMDQKLSENGVPHILRLYTGVVGSNGQPSATLSQRECTVPNLNGVLVICSQHAFTVLPLAIPGGPAGRTAHDEWYEFARKYLFPSLISSNVPSGPISEGAPVALSGSYKELINPVIKDIVSINWGDGGALESFPVDGKTSEAGQALSRSHVFSDNGLYAVNACIVTGGGAEQCLAAGQVTVTNVPPTVTPPADQTANEGTAKSFDLGSFSDPGVNDNPWAVDVDWGDGSTHYTASLASQGLLGSQAHTYADNKLGGYTVTVKVTDKDGDSDSKSFNVDVANVPPMVNTPQVAPEPSLKGSPVTVSATFTDPADTLDAPYTCEVDFGDGSAKATGTVNGTTCTAASHAYSLVNTHQVKVTVTDKDGGTGSSSIAHQVIYDYSGFFQPVDNPGSVATPIFNGAAAGSAIPVKFSLHGNQGLSIFATGYPEAVTTACPSAGATVDSIEETSTASTSGLQYDPTTDQYIYVWKTTTTMAYSCRQLVLRLDDGTDHVAYFGFK